MWSLCGVGDEVGSVACEGVPNHMLQQTAGRDGFPGFILTRPRRC